MLIDTHCHINMMVKESFDTLLSKTDLEKAQKIVQQATTTGEVSCIINVGTSLIESQNSITIARENKHVYAAVGIHPNDCTELWKNDVAVLTKYVESKEEHKIVAIGEIGLDQHYPNHDIKRQKNAFRAQIELALKHRLAIIVHTRNARDETLAVLDEYKAQISRGIIHCFSEDLAFALEAIAMGFSIGIGGPLTYPKNTALQHIAASIGLDNIVLETDAPFLAPQPLRGKQNRPEHVKIVAQQLALLRNQPYTTIAEKTTANAYRIFGINVPT